MDKKTTFSGLQFDVGRFHINAYYNIISEYVNFRGVKLIHKTSDMLMFLHTNEDGELRHFKMTPSMVGADKIIFERIDKENE